MAIRDEPIPLNDPWPAILPIFPLSGAIVLPRADLPLNIFEPRYLEMVRAALAGNGLIGMVQPRDAAGGVEKPPVYPIGTAGRITAHKETGDGRILITLTGFCRFAILEELVVETGYRQVRVDMARFKADLPEADPIEPAERVRMLAALKRYLATHDLQAEWESIDSAPDETLVSALCMICPFGPAEKQALLEAATLAERVRTLTMLFEFEGSCAIDPELRH